MPSSYFVMLTNSSTSSPANALLKGGRAGGGGDGAGLMRWDALNTTGDVHTANDLPSLFVTGAAANRLAAVDVGDAEVSAISAA